MNGFSERARLVIEYQRWLAEHPGVKDCPLSVIAYLEIVGRLKDRPKEDS